MIPYTVGIINGVVFMFLNPPPCMVRGQAVHDWDGVRSPIGCEFPDFVFFLMLEDSVDIVVQGVQIGITVLLRGGPQVLEMTAL